MTVQIKRTWNPTLPLSAEENFLTRLNEIRAYLLGNRMLNSGALAIGSTDDQVATGAFSYQIDGVLKTKAAVAAGTALPAGTTPIDKWGVYLVSIDAAGTITVTAGAANFGVGNGYATEALAIAALPDTPEDEVAIGYFTVLTEVGSAFVAATDALEGGAAGNPASVTNYYDAGVNDVAAIGEALEGV